jgi:hypothetical protein
VDEFFRYPQPLFSENYAEVIHRLFFHIPQALWRKNEWKIDNVK